MSFYPHLQVLALNLPRELLCRKEWPKGTFKARYAPGTLWTSPHVRSREASGSLRFAGKMLLWQAWPWDLYPALTENNMLKTDVAE